MASNVGKEGNADDRISKLPDSIVSLILSSIPMNDAVSTSILSTRWRYLFVSMFNLDVDLHIFRCPPPPHTVKSFTNLMDKLLFLHTEGRIEQFRLNHIDISGVDASHVCGWLSAALCRGVKAIDLNIAPQSNNFPMLSTALLFASMTLVRLKLEFPFLLSLPKRVCLPCLKTLELKFVKFEDDGSVYRLFSSCHVLDDLSISNCDMMITCLDISNPSLKRLSLVFDTDFDASCVHRFGIILDLPSLVYLNYNAYTAKYYSIVKMPCLVRAEISLLGSSLWDLWHPKKEERDVVVELFEGIHNVKSLHLIVASRSLSLLSHKRFVALQNLLHLYIFDRSKEWQGMGFLEFLEFTPNLQTLVMHDVSSEVLFQKENVPPCLLYQLKEFKVLNFKDVSSLLKLVSYILKNTRVLEKLQIFKPSLLKAEEKFEIANQLLSFPRSSNKCEVLTFFI